MAPLEVGLMTSIGMQATEPAGVPPHPPRKEDEELSTTSAVVVGGTYIGSHISVYAGATAYAR